jgi:hypothetical protein
MIVNLGFKIQREGEKKILLLVTEMPKNQLFRQIPPKEVCLMVLETFGIMDFDDGTTFSRTELKAVNCVERMEELKPLLLTYYLPCKARTYLHDLTEKNVITILRQMLRLHGYTISSKEKYRKGTKYILYQIHPLVKKKEDDPEENLNSDPTLCVVSFT